MAQRTEAFEYERSLEGDYVIYTLEGRLTTGRRSQELGGDLARLKGRRDLRIVFDFSDVSFLDSSGIGVLIVWKKIVEDLGGAQAVVAPEDGLVSRVLTSTRLIGVLGVHPDRDSALDYLETRYSTESSLRRMLFEGMRGERELDAVAAAEGVLTLFDEPLRALAFVESAMVDACVEDKRPSVRAVWANRITPVLVHLATRTPRVARSDAERALLLSFRSPSAFLFLVETALDRSGVATINAAGFETRDQGDLERPIGAFSPRTLVGCLGPDAPEGHYIQARSMLEDSDFKGRKILYAPGRGSQEETESALATVCADLPSVADALGIA